MIPSPPAGLGIFEAAAIAAPRPYEIDVSRVLACAVVLHAVTFFPSLLMGVLALRSYGRDGRARLLRRHRSLIARLALGEHAEAETQALEE